MTPFDIYLHGEWIDRVYYNEGFTEDSVRRSLIDHDGYDSEIVVISSNIVGLEAA